MSTLDDYRREAADRLARIESDLAALRTARSTDNADDEHDPEGSTLSSDWSQLSGLRAEALAQLQQADEALERLAAGSYGICVICGREIPAARLAVRPAARTCVACAV